MTTGIALDYIVLRCSDIERSRGFYAALGLQPVYEQHGRGAPHYSCNLGGVVLELYPLAGQASAGVRLGLRVANVRATVEAVVAAGGTVVRASGEGVAPSAVLRDPDGHEIAIAE